MDLTTSPPKSAHTKTETTPPLTQLNNNPLSFTISKLNNRHHRHGSLVLPPPEYKECLKNHAASLGGHALDGCGEFMPGTAEPAMLKCAACGCHRNFHRREPDDRRTTLAAHFLDFRPPAWPPRTLLTLGAASPEDQPTMNRHAVASPTTPTAEKPSGRKRFRTRFTREQKEKMLKLSQKLGWKMQRSDEGMVEELCNEIGVGKSVLKVWMHNNKNSLGKRDINSSDGLCFNTHPSINESSGLNLHLPTNASSSSS